MKNQKCFFYCLIKLTKRNVIVHRPIDTEHRFHELVELGKDETVPVAFDKWVSLKMESLLQDIDEDRTIAKTALIDMYVITE